MVIFCCIRISDGTIDSIKHRAKQAAYYSEGPSAKYNPFHKYRSASTRSNRREKGGGGVRYIHTYGDDVNAQKRREDLVDPLPKHYGTAPALIPGRIVVDPNDTLIIPRSDSPTRIDEKVISALPDLEERRTSEDVVSSPGKDARSQVKIAPDFSNSNRHKFTAGSQLRAVFGQSWVSLLLLFIPVGFAVNYTHQRAAIVFSMNFIAIIPCSVTISYAVEEITLRTGDAIGSLLNMTFRQASHPRSD